MRSGLVRTPVWVWQHHTNQCQAEWGPWSQHLRMRYRESVGATRKCFGKKTWGWMWTCKKCISGCSGGHICCIGRRTQQWEEYGHTEPLFYLGLWSQMSLYVCSEVKQRRCAFVLLPLTCYWVWGSQGDALNLDKAAFFNQGHSIRVLSANKFSTSGNRFFRLEGTSWWFPVHPP